MYRTQCYVVIGSYDVGLYGLWCLGGGECADCIIRVNHSCSELCVISVESVLVILLE